MSTSFPPNTATITPSVNPVLWSNSKHFNGWLLLGIAVPTLSSIPYPTLSLDASSPQLRIPQWIPIPITDGVVNQNTFIYFTNAIEPPNVQYVAYWYDINFALISGPSSLFTVTANPYTITVPTLTVPVAAVAGPTPDS